MLSNAMLMSSLGKQLTQVRKRHLMKSTALSKRKGKKRLLTSEKSGAGTTESVSSLKLGAVFSTVSCSCAQKCIP